MEEGANPYATPKAEVAVDATAPFFATSTAKLIALSLVTFGLYEVIWCYYGWKHVRARTARKLNPFLRALFAPIFLYSLCLELNEEAGKAGLEARVAAGANALAFFALSATWRLPPPWGLISLGSVAGLITPNLLARRLNERLAPDQPPVVPWSALNLVVLALGGVVFVLAVVGSFLPQGE